MDETRWADLLPDVVCEIAGWLDNIVDFVRFHAVCKRWRASRDVQPQLSRTTTTQFLPWLLAADGKNSTPLRFRCIFSKSSYRSMLPSLPPRYRVCSATAVRYLTTGHPRPSLYDALTGEATHDMPRLPYNLRSQWDKSNPQGVIYGDGTILLYSSSITNVSYDGAIRTMFTAALLRPVDLKWTLIDRTFDNVKHLECRAAYHGGKILVTIGTGTILQVIMPDVAVTGDLLVPGEYECKDSYILESRGELLWASVRTSYDVPWEEGTRKVDALCVLVQKLEEAATAQGKMRWVRKDECSMADRVWFLGSPNSFAIDASRLGSHGGCAYFVYDNSKGLCKAFPPGHSGVFKYNFLNAKTDFVERLPPGWDNERCTWLVPQPAIAPIQEITKRCEVLEVKQKQQKTTSVASLESIIHISKHYEPSFRVMVRNLPLTVNSSQLELFFRKHGKVFSAEVLYDKHTKCSQGVGFVAMSTVHAHPQDAVDAFGKMFLDGCNLEVTLVKQGRPRHHQRRHLPS